MGKQIVAAQNKLGNVKTKVRRQEKALSDASEELETMMQSSELLAASVREYEHKVKEADVTI